MSDVNFFKEISDVKLKHISSRNFSGNKYIKYLFLIPLLLILIIVIYNNFHLQSLKKDYIIYQDKLNDPILIRELNEISNIDEKINSLKNSLNDKKLLFKYFENRNLIDVDLLNKISSSLLADIEINKLFISLENDSTILGRSNSNEKINIFLKNLENLDCLQDVTLKNIYLDENLFDFEIKFKINSSFFCEVDKDV